MRSRNSSEVMYASCVRYFDRAYYDKRVVVDLVKDIDRWVTPLDRVLKSTGRFYKDGQPRVIILRMSLHKPHWREKTSGRLSN